MEQSTIKELKDVNILGVKVHEIKEFQALELVAAWLEGKEKHYIATPNIEFVMAAQKDKEFKKILNDADLAIPDSARFGWAVGELNEKNFLLKLLKWPLFFFPKLAEPFPVLTGTDFMDTLIKEAAKNNWSVGFLGGRDGVAEKLKQKLERKYSNLKISYADSGGVVDENGDVLWIDQLSDQSLPVASLSDQKTDKPKTDQHESENRKPITNNRLTLPNIDILFIAFGHGKQEKWITKNLKTQPVKIMMGVGGAVDYLSGEVKRAPKSWQNSGFEWLYRLLNQPWRAKRFLSLIKFTLLILFAK